MGGPNLFDYTKMEIMAGIFVVLGLLALGYLSISIGGVRVGSGGTYHVVARFANVGDLKARAPVKIAGVTVGRVESIRLADYYGEVQLSIDDKVKLPKDTIASIATAGLLGEAHVALTPGGDEATLSNADRITHTEPAINISDLIGRTAFGTANGAGGPSKEDAPGTKAGRDGGARP
jgi:phospholipid/cholesterol/gamma-HCH transport system substrate-binding protein